MTHVDSKKLLENIYDEEFGLRLTSSSKLRPVHVANGMARELIGRTYNTMPLNKTLRRFVRNQKLGVDQERNPGAAILADYPNAFGSLKGSTPDVQRLDLLRSLAFDVLGADGVVFDQHDMSSFTLANERFVTNDPSDERAGLFLARLLTTESKGGMDAADHLRELLSSEDDAWTTLALPLLEFTKVSREGRSEEVTKRAEKADHLFEVSQGRMVSPTLSTLRDACDRLARFERRVGSKLNSLRRLVLFGCFAIHVHAISRWSESQAEAPRPPILPDFFDGTVTSVRDASRATLRAAGDAIEGLIIARFREHVVREYGPDEEGVEAAFEYLSEMQEFASAFANYREGGRNAIDAMAQALVEEAFQKQKEHPVGTVIALGSRAGFLAPRSNAGRGGKLRKRYTATAEFLETLIAATVEPDDPLEFPEFLDRLKADFGIVVGRPEDDGVIRSNNILGGQFGPATTISEEDLRRNVEEMQRTVVESGYAKAYADGRTVVTTDLKGTL